MEYPARHLDVGKHLNRGDKGVIFLGPIELPNPLVLYHTEDEFTSLALRGFKCRVIAVPVLVYHLLSGADRCLLIVVY